MAAIDQTRVCLDAACLRDFIVTSGTLIFTLKKCHTIPVLAYRCICYMLLTDVWIACDTKYNMMTIKYIVFTYIAVQHLVRRTFG